MAMRIAFEINARDLEHFREAMRRARHAVRDAEDVDILGAAGELFARVEGTRVPAYVQERLDQLRTLVVMVEDEEWALTGQERERLLAALVYFCDPEDLIPDEIPGLGFLDDAIMVELAVRELRHEIEAYREFREYREKYDHGFHLRRDPAARARRLAARRDQLRERAARRRDREIAGAVEPAGIF
jgi:uncharacterized membrane protein YkvA (DUF1232 family)